MLDAFKMMGGNGKKAQKTAADELEALITASREERSALSEMLTQVTVRSGKLAQSSKSLDTAEKALAGTTAKVDDLGKRLQSLDERAKAMEDVDKKIKNLLETVKQAQT